MDFFKTTIIDNGFKTYNHSDINGNKTNYKGIFR